MRTYTKEEKKEQGRALAQFIAEQKKKKEQQSRALLTQLLIRDLNPFNH